VAGVLAAALIVAPSATAKAASPSTKAEAGRNNDEVVISNPGAAAEEEAPSTRRASRRGPSQPLPEHVIRQARLRNGGTPESCLDTTTTRRDTPMNGGEVMEYTAVTKWAELNSIAACSDEPEATVTPAQVAEAFLRTVPLPPPAPEIAPDGQAITGLAAFLETNGALAHALGPETTALGPISVEATGAYWVDWGDGSPEAGPFAFEGEAYPTGRIWHHYRWTGNYTVTLRQRWSATWSLGGDSGTVEGLLSETTVPVEVFEVQAVIRR
jgi:hypothetical protein